MVKPAGGDQLTSLKRGLLALALFNFFLVTVTGWLLRGMMWLAVFPLSFRNMAHGHSHFAFGGWVTPALLWMIMSAFPELTRRVAYRHWRNVIALLMVSAYGMLVEFPLQGYRAVSIAFSTLSIAATFYLCIVLLRVMKDRGYIPGMFLKAALFFLMLSAAGPLALGPVSAAGKAGTALYWNCIYFYLHFQYNGWFTFAILAVVYSKLLRDGKSPTGQAAFVLLFTGCVLSLFLSFLWNAPGIVYNFAGGVGAILQLAGAGLLLRDISRANTPLQPLEKIALSAFILKLLLQVISAFPFIAALGYEHRNFIIAFLHLIMLGWVSTFIISSVISTWPTVLRRRLVVPLLLYFFGFVVSEGLLVADAFSQILPFSVKNLALWVFIVSTTFPLSAFCVLKSVMNGSRAAILADQYEEDHEV